MLCGQPKTMKKIIQYIFFNFKKHSAWPAGLALLLLLLPLAAMAQSSKKTLEDKRKKLTKEIEVTNKLLNKAKKNKSAVFEQFVTLQNQIERREDLIGTIENEVVAIEEHKARNEAVIAALQQDVAQMKAEYGRILRHSFRLKSQTNPLMFLLSAENLNQAFRRWLFLRKYNKYRTGQAEAIAFTQGVLSKKIVTLATEAAEKEQLLAEAQGQKGTLSGELSDKNLLLQDLSADEAKFRSELAEKQKAKAALDQSIERIIAEDVRKQEAVAATKRQKKVKPKPPPDPEPIVEKTRPLRPDRTSPKSEPVPPTPRPAPPPAVQDADNAPEIVEEDVTSGSFKRQQGRLPWPVEGGFISRGFGKQKHPTLKNIEITNNGIDIRSNEDAPVRNIFEGKVAGVQFIPGHDYTVIIQHGNYYTVYSNLSETNLSKGDRVGAGVVIGRVSTNPISGAAELHFELWREKERLNPASWIK
jgi:murein hydrolase activator